MGLRRSDAFEEARNGQETNELRNRVTTKNIPDEGHYGFLSGIYSQVNFQVTVQPYG